MPQFTQQELQNKLNTIDSVYNQADQTFQHLQGFLQTSKEFLTGSAQVAVDSNKSQPTREVYTGTTYNHLPDVSLIGEKLKSIQDKKVQSTQSGKKNTI